MVPKDIVKLNQVPCDVPSHLTENFLRGFREHTYIRS